MRMRATSVRISPLIGPSARFGMVVQLSISRDQLESDEADEDDRNVLHTSQRHRVDEQAIPITVVPVASMPVQTT